MADTNIKKGSKGFISAYSFEDYPLMTQAEIKKWADEGEFSDGTAFYEVQVLRKVQVVEDRRFRIEDA